MRSSSGCWTCRLRRKKCDERQPTCQLCAALHITCHYAEDKPEWMDGGARQAAMADRVKREVREGAYRRSGGSRALHPLLDDTHSTAVEAQDVVYEHNSSGIDPGSGWPDAGQTMFYFESVLPFLFPFYRPTVLQGGRAWILDMLMSSSVVRQTAMCQSSYLFSLAIGAGGCDNAWEKVLAQARDAFSVLGESLRGLGRIEEHLPEAVRALASIMQVQRFELSIASFENCQAHLGAALNLFLQLLESAGGAEPARARAAFEAVMSKLAPSPWTLPSQCAQIPSTNQSALRFSSSLLILDDIIASVALQRQPKLYEYHRQLLGGVDAPVDVEPVVGCKNWVLVHLGEIAALDAWKQQRKASGELDMMELVQRATAIKQSLVNDLTNLEACPCTGTPEECNMVLNMFTLYDNPPSKLLARQAALATRVWAHAALVYLLIVVSGWQPAGSEVRHHVTQIIRLLAAEMSPPAMLRTMVWPFFVAGCLADKTQEASLRDMVTWLQPPKVFDTVYKALEIVEEVWRNRDHNSTERDIASCLKNHGGFILLV